MPLLGFTVERLPNELGQIDLGLTIPTQTRQLVALDLLLPDPTTESIINRDINTEKWELVATGVGSTTTIVEAVPEQYIRGSVKDVDGIGVARTVIAIDRATGQRLGITTSDSAGNFVLRPRSRDACVLIAVPLDGEQLNAVVLDNVVPLPG